ncbi:response regulator [Pelosinus propionicus]|uniref:Two-component system, chemotaxis family, response regulator CheY n=1 Tax=Pelosinus propionicus DSM 13327 TaxID=1123291 RepID=A0A1I4N5Y2_9FIRM|nr:response regulator [Pelosinus propionicus]SFM10717.1 two-component system, chemotaxis family, response regulator CheY [Pelosinus propionicus DSM 13327]
MARVLIVDDALMMRKTIRKMIENAGYIAEAEAINGEQAIQMYKEYMPDIVTMDITMPGIDGIEALRHIMAYDKDAKVIMVSALGQQYKVMEALECGAKSYILKPITAENLIAVINQVHDKSKTNAFTKPVFECGEGRHQQSCDIIVGKTV